ncbi:hypothetical protein PGT21_028006 [Puccinia graminis f. sp. tritici]|uniref:Uncharacterized protein n=1 Tax=Puccinia graminis f. sp. tritici TaxID=56615 RepID=A0A5B0QK10_PUCGR|nr:hypothetical protein PGT21_028006 [Puccinia graminis f. sp. tritici]
MFLRYWKRQTWTTSAVFALIGYLQAFHLSEVQATSLVSRQVKPEDVSYTCTKSFQINHPTRGKTECQIASGKLMVCNACPPMSQFKFINCKRETYYEDMKPAEGLTVIPTMFTVLQGVSYIAVWGFEIERIHHRTIKTTHAYKCYDEPTHHNRARPVCRGCT